MGTIPPKERRPHSRVIWALVVAGLLLVAGVAVSITYGWGPFARSPGSSAKGPAVRIQVDSEEVASLVHEPFASASGSIHIQIFSAVPSSSSYVGVSLEGLSAASNPYLALLFEGSPDSSGLVTGYLSTEFNSIDAAWLATLSPLTVDVSVQLYATLSVIQNGTDAVYTYYNSLPYDPSSPPSVFEASVSFPSTPAFSSPTSANSSPPALAPASSGGGGGSSCTPGWQWWGKNVTIISDGDLPMILVDIEGAPADSEATYGINYEPGTFEVSFNGVAVTLSGASLSGIQQSSTPTASALQAGYPGIDTSYDAETFSGGNPVTMLALTEVDVDYVNYQWDDLTSTCGLASSSNDFMISITPLGLSSSGFAFATVNLPSWFPTVMTHGGGWETLTTQSLVSGGIGFDLYTELESATGYASTTSAYQDVETFLSTLSMNLGLLAAASAAAGLVPGEGDVSAAACLAVVAAIAGYASGFLNVINSISFSTQVTYAIEGYNVNHGTGQTGTLTATLYSQSVGTELAISSGDYYPLLPLVDVVVT